MSHRCLAKSKVLPAAKEKKYITRFKKWTIRLLLTSPELKMESNYYHSETSS
jgi:hypothetical protein